jgi:hypothetical protein
MLIYLLWFLVSVLLCYGTLKASKKVQVQLSVFFLLALGIFVGLGDMLGGYDRYIYGELYDGMADFNRTGGNPWLSPSFAFYGGEFGYGTFCALLTYVTSNRYIFIFIATMVIYALLIRSLTKYVDNMPFAVVMFMALWFFFTFTYLRQVIGCTIAWLSIQYIIKRDWKRFLLVMFIAYSFHNSAIVFLPMYLVPIRKFSRKQVLVVMAAALLIGLSPVPQALFSAYGEADADRVNAGSYAMDAGFRWAYLIEAAFFLYVILRNYKNISNHAKDVVMLNMALVFCAILLFFIRSENGGRLGWYYMIGVMCTLSNICVKNKKLLAQGTLILIVSFFLYYRILDAWAFNMTPYKTFLTPGHTAAEWIYEQYEYDPLYDEDKLYR